MSVTDRKHCSFLKYELFICSLVVSSLSFILTSCLGYSERYENTDSHEVKELPKLETTPSLAMPDLGTGNSYVATVEIQQSISTKAILERTQVPDDWKFAVVHYSENDGGVYVFSKDNEKPVNISKAFQSGDGFTSPSWSPDAEHIVYGWGAVGVYKNYIRIANVDGGEDIELTRGESPSWSPNGDDILFTREGNVYSINSQSMMVTAILIHKNSLYGNPKWSPDSKMIAYVEYQNGNQGVLNIMLANGKESRTIDTHDLKVGQGIDWSPDGSKIVFASAERCGDIYVVDLQSGEVSNITNSLGDEENPTWAPDGNWITFSGTLPNQSCVSMEGQKLNLNYQIYSVRQEGGDYYQIFDNTDSSLMLASDWTSGKK